MCYLLHKEDIDTDVLLSGMKSTRIQSGINRITEIVDVSKVAHFNDGLYWITFKYTSDIHNWVLNGWVSVNEYNKWNLPKIRNEKIEKLIN